MTSLLATLTPAERAAGRFLRAPDHSDGGDPPPNDPPADPADPAGDPPPADDPPADPPPPDEPAADGGDDDPEKSLINGGKGPDDEDDKDGDDDGQDEAAQLPEKYELTAPEGFEIDDALLAEVDPVFRELKLTNEQADKLMPLAGKFADRIFKAQNDAFQAQATDWARASKADPVLGGKNWKETESLVAKAMDTAAAKLPEIERDGKKLSGADQVAEFRALLDTSKLGNHPTLMRMFRFFGAQFTEGGFVRADAGAPVKPDRLAALYPDDVPQKEGAK